MAIVRPDNRFKAAFADGRKFYNGELDRVESWRFGGHSAACLDYVLTHAADLASVNGREMLASHPEVMAGFDLFDMIAEQFKDPSAWIRVFMKFVLMSEFNDPAILDTAAVWLARWQGAPKNGDQVAA